MNATVRNDVEVKSVTAWRAIGLLFENCNCQLVCPGHISFKQLCTHERCIGAWAIHIEEGRYGDVVLDGLDIVIVWDSPQHMIAGGWTELFLVGEQAGHAQREALETIFSGKAGGPWEVLARFVAKRMPTRYVPLRFEDAGRQKRMVAEDLFDMAVEAIRGKDKSREVSLENAFNQIHAPTQVLALGRSRLSSPDFSFEMEGSHALYSRFSWEVM
ncbi:MAG TPA: DUF1326 domain-containing protein [Candidatus Deferrimicrobiaceae bacterium]|jgi:hypothetical protein